MSYCPGCGERLSDDAKNFCPSCGASLKQSNNRQQPRDYSNYSYNEVSNEGLSDSDKILSFLVTSVCRRFSASYYTSYGKTPSP